MCSNSECDESGCCNELASAPVCLNTFVYYADNAAYCSAEPSRSTPLICVGESNV